MRERILRVIVAGLVGAGVGGIGGLAYYFVTRTSPRPATPTHVVSVFVDGLNNADYRQVCGTVNLAGKETLAQCVENMVGSAGQALLLNGEPPGGYSVIPHSEKEWSQPYQGRTVELATVKISYGPAQATIVAHLAKLHGRWLLTRTS